MKKIFALFTVLTLSFVFAFAANAEETTPTPVTFGDYTFEEGNDFMGGDYPITEDEDGRICAQRPASSCYSISGWYAKFNPGTEDEKTYHFMNGNVGNYPQFSHSGSLAAIYTSGFGDTITRNQDDALIMVYIDPTGKIAWFEATHTGVHTDATNEGKMGRWEAQEDGSVLFTEYTEANPAPTEITIEDGAYVLAFEYLDRTGTGFSKTIWELVGTTVEVGNLPIYGPYISGLSSFWNAERGENFYLYANGTIATFDPLAPQTLDATGAEVSHTVYAVDPNAVDGDISSQIVVGGDTVEATTNGDYSITYTLPGMASDGSDITANLHVVIVDFEIFNKGDHDITLSKAQEIGKSLVHGLDFAKEHFLQNVSAFEATLGDISDTVEIDLSQVDFTVPGDYEVIYTVTRTSDGAEKIVSETFTIMDNIAPTLYGVKDVTVMQDDLTFDPLAGIIAMDDNGEELEARITNLQDLRLDTPGTYTLTVKVLDAASNPTEATFTVTVLEKEAAPEVYTETEVDDLLANKADVSTDFGLIIGAVALVGAAAVGVFTFTKKQ